LLPEIDSQVRHTKGNKQKEKSAPHEGKALDLRHDVAPAFLKDVLSVSITLIYVLARK
jgi:hypothetical protein